MAREGRLYHSQMDDLLRKCGMSAAGENVARGYADPERTVAAWMQSPGHRDNLLNPRFTKMGTGWVAEGSWATQQFGA